MTITSNPSTVSLDELREELAQRSVLLLEALPETYFDREHLPGARNLPLDELEELAPALVPDLSTPVVAYCSGPTCTNSTIAAARLVALGYTDVRVYEGGKEEWADAGLALESGPARRADQPSGTHAA